MKCNLLMKIIKKERVTEYSVWMIKSQTLIITIIIIQTKQPPCLLHTYNFHFHLSLTPIHLWYIYRILLNNNIIIVTDKEADFYVLGWGASPCHMSINANKRAGQVWNREMNNEAQSGHDLSASSCQVATQPHQRPRLRSLFTLSLPCFHTSHI